MLYCISAPACLETFWCLLPSALAARPKPTGPRCCEGCSPGWAGPAEPAQQVFGLWKAIHSPSARREVVSPIQARWASFRTMRLWQVGPMASGLPSPESTKAFGTPPSPATPSEQPLWQWVRPRQTLPAPPCTGHQLYLPQRGSALAPRPSAICSPSRLRGQPGLGHSLPLATGSHAGDRLRQTAALRERSDAALRPLPAPASRTHTHRYPHTWSACHLTTCRERGRPTP